MGDHVNYLETIRNLFNENKYKDAELSANELMKSFSQQTKEYVIVDGICKLCHFLTGTNETVDIASNLKSLKEMNSSLEWAWLKLMEIEALCAKNMKETILRKTDDFLCVEKVLKNYGAKKELERIGKIKEWLFNEMAQRTLTRTIKLDYLEVFNQIGEIVDKHLNDDNFCERVLDVLITITNSERGALFFIEGSKLKLVAGRNVELETISDASKISRSIIKETSKGAEIICCSDAIIDSRFKKSKSVLLNQIRSIICAPLKVKEKIIGAIYLDSRAKGHVFSEEDKCFLLTVTHFVASLMERSKIFQKLKEENIFLRREAFNKFTDDNLIGVSPAMCKIRDMIRMVAETDSTTLITGETGVGKGLVAQLIHQKSKRENGKFIAFSCGAVPETLFESELFGHKKGAFTGAVYDKKGLFEEADGGTLFLDDISNTPFAVQAKLLQAIEEKTIRRLGEITERMINVRLISATNQDLRKMTKKESFREDLFYRITVLTIHIPALRERTIDIPILADYFLKKYALKMQRAIHGFHKKTMKKMLSYSWPGNVRELQNAIESAVDLTQGQYIMPEDINLTIIPCTKERWLDKETIMNILKTTKGNVSLASKHLGITRRTIYRYLRKYEIHVTKE